MKQETKEKIESFLKKAGFWKLSGKDVWCESKVPNQKVCDLTKEPPWIGISTGVGRIEAEDSGIALIQDYKSMILQIYNSSETENQDKKSPDAGIHIPAPPQEEKAATGSPPINSSIVAPVISGDESNRSEELPYLCSGCPTKISAQQRTDSVKALGKAFCQGCISKKAEEIAEKMKPKEDIKAPEPKPEPAKEKTKTKGKKKDEPKTEKKIETPAPAQQGAEPIKPVMCQDCGFELSYIRALEYQICEGCAEKRKVKAAEEVPLKSRDVSKEKEKIMSDKPETEDIVPAGKPCANAPAPISDHERDQQIEKAKARKFLEGQGGSYKVNGIEVPDSARIQNISNEQGISVMILESQQNEDFARVRVRGLLGGQAVDDEVWVDFDTELKLLMMEFIRKNEGVLDHFDGLNPVFKEGAKIKNFDGTLTDARYALVHAMLTLRKFAVRTAGTKAAKRVQMKLMNKEFREKEEIADEQAEQDLVSKKRK